MGEYSSEFEYDSGADRRRSKRNDLTAKSIPQPQSSTSTSSGSRGNYFNPTDYSEAIDREARATQRFHLLGLDAYSRHKKLINEYLLCVPGSTNLLQRDTSRDRTDLDVIRENHRFLWDDETESELPWEQRLAKKYYDKLFKEYCIADLRAYKLNKFGMRWRTEKEVVDGKGQFSCGSKHCANKTGLRSWEVNFAYLENAVKKNALVKLRLCTDCSKKLNYTVRHKEAKTAVKPLVVPSDQTVKLEDEEASQSEVVPAPNLTAEELKQQEKAIWESSVLVTDDRSRNQEFDQYFTDLLL